MHKNGSLIDDKNVNTGLKIKILLKTSLFYVKGRLFHKSVLCRLKMFKSEYLKVEKNNGS